MNGEFPKNTKKTVMVHTPPNVPVATTPDAARTDYRALLTRCDELARALGNMITAYDRTDVALDEIHVAEARKLHADYLAAGMRVKRLGQK